MTAVIVIGFPLMLRELRKVLTQVKQEQARKNIAQIICNFVAVCNICCVSLLLWQLLATQTYTENNQYTEMINFA